jgi:uncharacterized protein
VKKQMIQQTELFVRNELGKDATGHDWHHVDRVRRNALYITKEEQAGEPFIIEMAALLHDIPDEKLNETKEQGERKLAAYLQTLPLEAEDKYHIQQIIATISYKGGNGVPLQSIEAKIVQDADRLDAIGAIGIARAFAYGGKKGQPIYDPNIKVRDEMSVEEYRKGKSSTIHHFYEKLLKLKNLLNTETAKYMAESRQQMMELFLQQFYQEWKGQ